MKTVWIVTTKLLGGNSIVEGAFASYELAHIAANGLWPCYGDNLWKHTEFNQGKTCIMNIWKTEKKTFKEKPYCTITIEPYLVWH